MSVRVALAQIAGTPDPERNLELVRDHATRASVDGADLVVFPEATMRSFGGGSLTEIAEPLDGPWADAIREIAASTSVAVVVGMFRPAAPHPDSGRDRVFNTILVTGRGLDTHYDKIHLFDAFGFAESDTVAPGDDPLVVDLDGTPVGVATCYDIRFPALFQGLADRGAVLTVVPTSWGDGPGKLEQWRVLTRARALDATTFVAACDQALPAEAGRGAAPRGIGHSVVVGPDGAVVAEAGAEPDLLVVDVDTDRVATVRGSIPVLANRRFTARAD